MATDPCGSYRVFVIYHDPDGWYGETPGGTCLGPFDSFADLRVRIDEYRASHQSISIRLVQPFDVVRKHECWFGR